MLPLFSPPLVVLAAGSLKLLQFINGKKDKIETLETTLKAVKSGADGTLTLLGEVLEASKDNTLTVDEFNKIVAAASDIPSAIRIALKKSTVTSVGNTAA